MITPVDNSNEGLMVRDCHEWGTQKVELSLFTSPLERQQLEWADVLPALQVPASQGSRRRALPSLLRPPRLVVQVCGMRTQALTIRHHPVLVHVSGPCMLRPVPPEAHMQRP